MNRCIRCDRKFVIETSKTICIVCIQADNQSNNPRGKVVKGNGKSYP